VCLVLSFIGVPAQDVPARIDWFFSLSDLPTGEYGSIYHVYDSRQRLRFQLGFTNGSNQSVRLPADVLSRIRFVLSRSSSKGELPVEWESAIHSSTNASDSVPVGLGITLGPGDSYGVIGVLTAPLADGEQLITLNVTAAVEGLTWSDGSPWRGLVLSGLGALVRVLKPETVAERRTYHLIESNVALRSGDAEAALGHARQILEENPNEPSGTMRWQRSG
jgi:hypothetical protein